MWHQRKFIRPKQEPANVEGTCLATGTQMLDAALLDVPATVYATAYGIDPGQLRRIARAARLVAQAAQDELDAR